MGGATCKYDSCNYIQDCPADDDINSFRTLATGPAPSPVLARPLFLKAKMKLQKC